MKPKGPKSCSLVITTYNWPEALDLTLRSAFSQSEPPSEIIIADDGSTRETAALVESYRNAAGIPLHHIWQADLGYRLAASRNRAIAFAQCEYIVIVDGDMVLQRHFIHDHKRSARKGSFIQGSRVLLPRRYTSRCLETKEIDVPLCEKGIQNRKNAIRLPGLSTLLGAVTGTSLKGIRGCNLSFFRQDCISVNGFNEDFTGWGREDSEFAVRLINRGILRRNVKFSAVAYHLWHAENKRDSLPENDLLLEKAVRDQATYCPNGINKYFDCMQS
ncbi:MAG: glycosyltransferase [Chlorobiaceae bacterium]|nr:glycosyltransferase [Chlorobiaceae bacterium]NTV60763.1 glycosyltransferase [Chlorobiaceae bacterium]